MRKSIDTSSPKRCVSDAAECSPSRRQKYDASGSVRVKSHGLNRGSALARPHFKSTRHKKIVSFASLSFPSGFEVSCDKSSKGCLLRSDSQRSSESSVLQFAIGQTVQVQEVRGVNGLNGAVGKLTNIRQGYKYSHVVDLGDRGVIAFKPRNLIDPGSILPIRGRSASTSGSQVLRRAGSPANLSRILQDDDDSDDGEDEDVSSHLVTSVLPAVPQPGAGGKLRIEGQRKVLPPRELHAAEHGRRFHTFNDAKQVESIWEWWPASRCQQEGITFFYQKSSSTHTNALKRLDVPHRSTTLAQRLRDKGVSVKLMGQDGAKSVKQLWQELRLGECYLVDHPDKGFRRVVDVVVIRIRGPRGKILVETMDFRKGNASERERNMLPASKRRTHEGLWTTAQRVVSVETQMPFDGVQFDQSAPELIEDEQTSSSYPTLITLYRKHFIEARVLPNSSWIGLTRGSFQTVSPHGTVHFWTWLTEEQCTEKGIQFQAARRHCLADGIAVVYDGDASSKETFPTKLARYDPSNLDQAETLAQYLARHEIDPALFGIGGAKTLSEFANELRSGEAQLMYGLKYKQKIVRMVDVVALRVVDRRGQILVLTQQVLADGRSRTRRVLPGSKRRPAEDVFTAARRIFADDLQFPLRYFHLTTSPLETVEEHKESPSYPGLNTVYTRHIVECILATKDNQKVIAGASDSVQVDMRRPARGRRSQSSHLDSQPGSCNWM